MTLAVLPCTLVVIVVVCPLEIGSYLPFPIAFPEPEMSVIPSLPNPKEQVCCSRRAPASHLHHVCTCVALEATSEWLSGEVTLPNLPEGFPSPRQGAGPEA